ncbi:MAG: quinolinate synthase NadA [Phycisphaeraceae bacterium]|nr:MAG: quinolinate synthase NadA [Phycisphaeraceae bacterium]
MLWQPSLPEAYHAVGSPRLGEAIEDRRRRLGERLVILGHHYQQDEVVRHADFAGDSLKLSQLAAGVAAERDVDYVVFCGVHFMAETADMLTPESVKVILPDLSAGCSMADMAAYDETVQAWAEIHEALNRVHGGRWQGRVVPITYVNSSAAIKAFVGEHDGACCTSSNADRVFEWAMRGGVHPRGEDEEIKVLFLPDQHLGRNTAAKFGIDVATRSCVYDPKAIALGDAVGGSTREQVAQSDAILWAGHCSVHKLFRPEHCDAIRKADGQLDPGIKPTRIIVHPECAKDVVDKADLAGSTEFIINRLRESEPGDRWAVGTEVHLVHRLADELRERGVEVRMLSECQCLCTTMYRIDEPHLLWVLDGLCGLETQADGTPADAPTTERNVIHVHPEIRGPALLAVSRMLELTSPASAGS